MTLALFAALALQVPTDPSAGDTLAARSALELCVPALSGQNLETLPAFAELGLNVYPPNTGVTPDDLPKDYAPSDSAFAVTLLDRELCSVRVPNATPRALEYHLLAAGWRPEPVMAAQALGDPPFPDITMSIWTSPDGALLLKAFARGARLPLLLSVIPSDDPPALDQAAVRAVFDLCVKSLPDISLEDLPAFQDLGLLRVQPPDQQTPGSPDYWRPDLGVTIDSVSHNTCAVEVMPQLRAGAAIRDRLAREGWNRLPEHRRARVETDGELDIEIWVSPDDRFWLELAQFDTYLLHALVGLTAYDRPYR